MLENEETSEDNTL